MQFLGNGDTLQCLAPRDLRVGQGFLLGPLFCVAQNAAQKGGPVSARAGGLFAMGTDATFHPGEVVCWDDKSRKPAKTGPAIGVCVTASGNVGVTVRLIPGLGERFDVAAAEKTSRSTSTASETSAIAEDGKPKPRPRGRGARAKDK